MSFEIEILKPKYELFQKVIVEFNTSFRNQTIKVTEKLVIVGVKTKLITDRGNYFSTPSFLTPSRQLNNCYRTTGFAYEVCDPEKGTGTDMISENQIVGFWEE